MRILKFIFVIVAFIFFSSRSLAEGVESNEIGYASVFDDKGVALGFDENSVKLFDLSIPAIRCRDEEKFVCIKSKNFVFSIPRKMDGIRSWHHAGANYQIMQSAEGNVFGKFIRYKIIQQRWRGLISSYAYSEERGVFAIMAKNRHQLLLVGNCGIAAISNQDGCEAAGVTATFHAQ